MEVATKHAIVLAGVILFVVFSFFIYLICKKSPVTTQNTIYSSFSGLTDSGLLEMNQPPPSYNQLERMGVIQKIEESPPPSYEELTKDA